MVQDKENIICQLREHILFLHGLKKASGQSIEIKLGEIDQSFPGKCFPVESIHEFVAERIENVSATNGYISHIISQLMKSKGMCIWIGPSQSVFPLALKSFGVEPDKVVFINVQNSKERLWVIEEALKCEGLSAVVGEVKEIGFTESRRFQLAVEKSRTTGFIISNSGKQNINACISRWRISQISSDPNSELPGVGFPRWNIELLKIRNGKPGSWQMEFSHGKLQPILSSVNPVQELERKTG
jgi:protein ImuA